MNKDSTCALYDLFADLLSYPGPNLLSQAAACLETLRVLHPQAADALGNFHQAMQPRTLEQNEELYTLTFDMQPVCYPYVGYHLFGETYKRGAFMAQLNEAYHAFGYFPECELPDHIPTILRFLGLDSANRRGDFCQTLLSEGVVPALDKMRATFSETSQNPYAHLLTALHLVLAPIAEPSL